MIDSPISGRHVMAFSERGKGFVDVFGDLYIFIPNDGRDHTVWILRTSLFATAPHWWQYLVSGVLRLIGRPSCGNEEAFTCFVASVSTTPEALEPIGPECTIAVLELQHQIIESAEGALGP